MFDSLKQKLKDVFKKVGVGLFSIEPTVGDSTPSPTTEQVLEKQIEGRQVGSKEYRVAAGKDAAVIVDVAKRARFGKKVREDSLDEFLWNLEIVLLESDVALSVIDEIKKNVKKSLVGARLNSEDSLAQLVEFSVKDAIKNTLEASKFDFDVWFEQQDRPVSVMFVGINGTGKTTTIAKIANYVMNSGYTVVMAAGDTFRAGAIEQISIHAENLGCKVIKHSQNADPAAVAFDAIKYAKMKKKDVVFIDTAGRMQTDKNLIDEMKKIVRVAKPELKIFVGDSLAGNDIVEQVRVFNDAIGVDAAILTKMDADSKGGAVLSIASAVNIPIAFICNGQRYEDIIKFDVDWMMHHLFSGE
ncbi:MAG: signal recognition particle-docking protein FtsY [archaeon]|nr:signal recognition particle-docking protein FtsY [archaeon]